MKYRKFGRLDWEGSVLGFGAMRLPQNDANPANVNEAEAIRMIRHAIDSGVNYVDTAYTYHGGKGESFVGLALRDGYRQKVKLATKMPVWFVQSPQDFDRYLKEQLEHLQTDRVDFYLLHGLDADTWPAVRDLGVLRWAEGAIADGRVGHLGFSFHDEFEVFKDIVDAYDKWDFCQIQYNFMDTEYQAGTKGLKYAAERGMGVVIMEPLRGGSLTKKPPEVVDRIWAEAVHKRTPAEWALLWVWEHPEVSVVLSGMSTMEQLQENLEIADRCGPGALTGDEQALIERVEQAYRKLGPVPCTGCGYCMPCNNGVEIPRIFQIYNDAVIYNDLGTGRFLYRGPTGLKPEQRADQCLECEDCADICPQHLPIPELLKKAHELLGPRKQAAG
ncbi:MAG: aldo/keto reductase [Dehalococcoidia bacterium]|nr:aldo/keto reductase [Dehalococcoidia bacterium]MDD5493597.1 aldo/keto reductase [Dehalococcoidia bacterium]